ncbi:MAG: DivIVA domain-containing protein [Gaiellaceae bacterium]
MALTPVEIRHITLGRSLFGYSRPGVDKLLDDIVVSFEDVWRTRADLADKIELLEQELARHRDLETLLRTTLVSAERASQELKEQARREADLLLTEAHAEARKVGRDAIADVERMRAEAQRIRALLGAALSTLAEGAGGTDEDTAAPGMRAA